MLGLLELIVSGFGLKKDIGLDEYLKLEFRK
ncbi:hypothetical protein HNR33_001207 [Brassicibacter mesophilus]